MFQKGRAGEKASDIGGRLARIPAAKGLDKAIRGRPFDFSLFRLAKRA
jgi:hypothetical protein